MMKNLCIMVIALLLEYVIGNRECDVYANAPKHTTSKLYKDSTHHWSTDVTDGEHLFIRIRKRHYGPSGSVKFSWADKVAYLRPENFGTPIFLGKSDIRIEYLGGRRSFGRIEITSSAGKNHGCLVPNLNGEYSLTGYHLKASFFPYMQNEIKMTSDSSGVGQFRIAVPPMLTLRSDNERDIHAQNSSLVVDRSIDERDTLILQANALQPISVKANLTTNSNTSTERIIVSVHKSL